MADTFVTHSEAETAAVGRRLGASLTTGRIILLFGDLGAGKTAFVRGLAEGLGASSDDVSSPTFTLIQEYPARLKLYHVDLYRIEPREVDDLGIDELMGDESVVAIEWAERLPRRPPDAMEVKIEDEGGTQRKIRIT